MTCPNCKYEADKINFLILGLEPMYGSYWHEGDKPKLEFVDTAMYDLRACPKCGTMFVVRQTDDN